MRIKEYTQIGNCYGTTDIVIFDINDLDDRHKSLLEADNYLKPIHTYTSGLYSYFIVSELSPYFNNDVIEFSEIPAKTYAKYFFEDGTFNFETSK